MNLGHTIVLSILGHGILLMSWPHVANFSVATTTPSYKITILNPYVNKTSKNTNPQSQNKKAFKSTTTNVTQNTNLKPESGDRSITENIRKKSETQAYVINNINTKLRKNFIYPWLARKNGWEGKVLLSLFINSEGSIENAQIKSGSGYLILDRSALNALLKIKSVQKTKNLFNINHQEIIIPVVYRLQKG